MHKTRIEPIEVFTIDAESDERREVVAFRVYCKCGFVSPVPLLTQLEANRDAREHREMYEDAALREDL